MKKHIITVITITACIALCAAVWPRSAEDSKVPAEAIKNAVIADIEARSEELQPILLYDGTRTPEPEAVAGSEPAKTGITAEEKTQKPEPIQQIQAYKSSKESSEPCMGDVRIINGEKQIYFLGFGWVKDEGGGSHGTMVGNPGDELTGNKVGKMGGSTTVHGKGDINKQVGVMGAGDAPTNNTEPAPGTEKYIDGKLHVWVPGFGYVPRSGTNVGTVATDMYESGIKIGIMGDEEPTTKKSTPPTSEQPEPRVDEINIVFVEVPEKNSTSPPYKPDTTSP